MVDFQKVTKDHGFSDRLRSNKLIKETLNIMKITRPYTGTDNQSHFEDLDIELKDKGPKRSKISLEARLHEPR